MRVAVGSDERTHLTDFIVNELKKRGHEVILCGALIKEGTPWPDVGLEVAEKVASGECNTGIVMCWTSTGVCVVANKVRGIRATSCFDAETARGARKWNDANVLALSLRLTSEAVAREILDAWFGTPFDENERSNVLRVGEIESKYMK
jgi:ribose 5-phosphate isomerase B